MIALASANLLSRHSTARCSALAILDAGESPTGGVCRPAVGFWSAYLKFVGGLLCVDNTRAGTNGEWPPPCRFRQSGRALELMISPPRPARYDSRKPAATFRRPESRASARGRPRASGAAVAA